MCTCNKHKSKKSKLLLIFILALSLHISFSQKLKNVGVWCFDNELKHFKKADTLLFITPGDQPCEGLLFLNKGYFEICNNASAIKVKGRVVVCNWINSGTWAYYNSTLTLQTDSVLITLKLVKDIKDYLKFVVENQQSVNVPKYNTVFDRSPFHVGMSFGMSFNIPDKRTRYYLPNYLTSTVGLSFSFKKFILSYSFNPTSLGKVKNNFSSAEGIQVNHYDRNPHKKYWLNILRHTFDLGYEKKIKNMWSIIPSVGLSITYLKLFNDSSTNAPPKKLGRFYGESIGLAIRKYYLVTPNIRFFFCLNTYYSVYNINTKFTDFGSGLYSISFSAGIKFKSRSTPSALFRNPIF